MHRIKNYTNLAHSPAHRDALDIIESGLAAIDTPAIIRKHIRLESDILHVGYRSYSLSEYRHVHVIGFGKASYQAAMTIENILGSRIHSGIALMGAGGDTSSCAIITLYESSHPLPSSSNVTGTKALIAECEKITADDLVLVLVSGGGSAMLCWPTTECEQGIQLYAAANKKGLTVHELNTVRKHISALKGGGLAKLLHPARVVGIIFSDVPGDMPELVASGPTYPDTTTIEDAKRIIEKYELGEYQLSETPKESLWFERVDNFVIVSNETALSAMAATAEQLGYTTDIIAANIYDEPEHLAHRFFERAKRHSVILGAGEPRLTIANPRGMGGRNQHVALVMAAHILHNQIFASIASDGIDNGASAGALIDSSTNTRARAAGIDVAAELQLFNDQPVLEAAGNLVFTGPTGTNVSDLMMLLVS
jgi:hydroxypyruvate reductase/glycerate 2-kinase